MTLKKRIARNFVVSFAGRFLAGALGVLSLAFITRALGSEQFGEYSIVFAYLYIFLVLADFGLNSLLAREISKPGADEKEIISRMFSAKILLLVFFTAVSFLLLFFTPYSPAVKVGVFVASLGFIFSSLAGVLMGVFQKHLKTIIPAIADVSARLIQLTLVFVLYKYGGGLRSFLAVFVLGSAVHFALICFFAKKYTGFHLDFNMAGLKSVLKESWPLAVSAVLVLVYFKGDTIILSFMKTPYDVGIYGVAYKILENIIFFPIMFVGLTAPLLSKYFISDHEAFKKVFQKTLDFLMVIAIPLVLGGVYTAKDIIRIIAGPGFGAAAPALQILLVAVFFIFLGALFGSTVITINKQKSVMYVYGLAAVFNISANFYFIARYSYIGAAWVTAATELFVSLGMLLIIRKIMNYSPNFNIIAKALAASLLMVALLYASPSQNLFALLALGAASYAVFMYILGGITKEDFLTLIRRED